MCELDTTLALLAEKHYKGIILIKSTVLPDYCAEKNTIYPQLRVIHNPEFLSASTAVEDFANQVQIILGYTSQSQACVNNISEFYGKLFPSAILSVTTSTVAGLAKLACNSFYATKVQFFTDLFFLCEKKQIEFNEVKKLMLNNQWIHERHTTVPGPDGRVSFGGACLPKDISALNQYMIQKKSPNNVLDAVINERNSMRND
jgi:UDP-glucose 6-dehydrogenase